MHRSSIGEIPAPLILVIQFDLQCILSTRSTLDLPQLLEQPSLPDLLPATDADGHGGDIQNRALNVLAWISAHIVDREFRPGSVDS